MAPQPMQAKVVSPSPSPPPCPGLVNGLEIGVGAVSDSQRTWLYLEETANTLMSTVQQLKALIEQAKQQAGGPVGSQDVCPSSVQDKGLQTTRKEVNR